LCLTFLGGLATLGTGTAIHFLTLPTEFDASFRRALPLLRERRILHPGDESRAHRILTAAALTYVSASLMSLLNIARWWAIIRR
jgi:Zn-dependent membrane protease YugP